MFIVPELHKPPNPKSISVAKLPETVEFDIFKLPILKKKPPHCRALLPEKV